MSTPLPQVFISYQRTDGDYAVQIREHLVFHGVRTWMDQYNIPVGAYWPDAIDEGLTASDIVIGILSPEAMASRNVKNEWDWAIQNDKRLLLLQVKPSVIPHRYVSINFIDASGSDHGPAFAALLETLGIPTQHADQDDLPETHYARSGEVSIAYQVLGDGPIDLVHVPGFISNVEVFWESPDNARFIRRLASFSRVIRFDKRGTGLSDRVGNVPTLDQRMDDVRAVMDAVGSERALLMGISEGGPMSVLFAATYPDRTIGLILFGAFAKGTWSPDHPWAPTAAFNELYFERLLRYWGTEEPVFDASPSAADDPAARRWWARYQRLSASPGGAVALERMNADIDIRHVLPSIRVPTIVLHRQGDRVINVGEGRYLGEHIPGARYVELVGDDHSPVAGDQDAWLNEVETFVTGIESLAETDVILATVLGIAVVYSDEADAHEWLVVTVHTVVLQHRGRVIGDDGDTLLATFDGPTRAVRCAEAIRDAAQSHGFAVRAGLHTGEVELRGDAIDGQPLRLAAQLTQLAVPGEIVLTSTVKNLVAGSGIRFKERDSNELIDLPDECHLYAVDQTSVD